MQKIQRRLEGMIRGNTKIMSAVLIAAMTVTAMTPLMTAAKEEHGTAADASDSASSEETADDAAGASSSEASDAPAGTSQEETEAAAPAASRTIKTNLLESFNTGFEGADGSGNVYWWNDSAWKQVHTVRTAYQDSGIAKPSADSGDYYLTVSPESETKQAQAQLCSADIAKLMKAGKTYEYTCYVRLAKGETEGKVTLAVNSISSDWSTVKSATVVQDQEQQLSDREWTPVSGTISMPENEKNEQVQLQFGGDAGETYLLDDLKIGAVQDSTETDKKKIEWDIPNLKDTISSKDGIGTDGYTGVAIMSSEISDGALMDLVTKHFNAVTFGNELKPDCLFGYHDGNKTNPGTETVSFTFADGTTDDHFVVPKLDYSRAEGMLDKLLDWNEAHPDAQIKVRGHVLVWHSQTPEWFFHENWDASQPYVSREVMNRRQEWYIATVLQHFTGSSSRYKDMFYGWDVVNEAVSDGGGYRKDTENSSDSLTDATHGSKSSWWKIYQSNEYIVNAFRYANHYAPSSLELYYNDYNECGSSKKDDIIALLKAVKEHESDSTLPTRISAMGMQSHYNTSQSPTMAQFESAARAYAAVVGKVQMTELDLKATADYDGTKNTLDAEYTREAYRYKDIFDSVRKLEKEGVDFGAVTFWGVIDGNSWLQSRSDVGGGADGTHGQVPLLFDDDYKAKPAFYAFTDAEKLEPLTQSVNIMQAADQGDDIYAHGTSYTVGRGETKAVFTPVWNQNELKIRVKVQDSTADADDSVTVYLDPQAQMKDGAQVQKVTVTRSQAEETDGGYTAQLTFDGSFAPADHAGIDFVLSDNGTRYAYNNYKMTQDDGSRYYASASMKPYMNIAGGSVQIDGEIDRLWNSVRAIPLSIRGGSPKASAQARFLWDDQYLYVLTQVTDPVLDDTASAVHEKDSVETFIDENNGKADSYEADDKQYRVNYKNEQSFNGKKCTADNCVSATRTTADGYLVEAAYRWTDLKPSEGTQIGIDLQVNDAQGGSRIGTLNWYDASGNGWSSPKVFGTAQLTGTTHAEGDKAVSALKFKMPDKMKYTGESITFDDRIRVKDGSRTLAQTAEKSTEDGYTVSYENNVNAGTASVTIHGTGKYYGTAVKTFRIEQVKLKSSMFGKVRRAPLVNGKAEPAVSGSFNGKALTQGQDYTVTYQKNTKAGKKGKITIKGTGNFEGKVSMQFFVTARP